MSTPSTAPTIDQKDDKPKTKTKQNESTASETTTTKDTKDAVLSTSKTTPPQPEQPQGAKEGDKANGVEVEVKNVTTATSAQPAAQPPTPSESLSDEIRKIIQDNSTPAESEEDLVALCQEPQEGNIEYKLKLVDPTPERFQHLVTQMKWRLDEGQGEAIYEIGVEDNGYPRGLPEEDMKKSLDTLSKMSAELKAVMTVLVERPGKSGKIAEVLVREMREENHHLMIRVAVCGNVDSGKSTLIGVLTRGMLDNGRGSVRLAVFNHKHEIETGRTSSISQQLLGFDGKGKVVHYSPLRAMDIIEESSKLLSFIDLAGHEKYLKTTVSGMTGHMPDYCLLLVGANMGVTRMTKEHLGLALALKIPVIAVVTKIDMCPPNVFKETLASLKQILKMRGVRKLPCQVKGDEDVLTCAKNLDSDRIVPIFFVSSVTGQGLALLQKFFNLLPARIEWNKHSKQPTEVVIDETFNVTGVGTVIGGTVVSGSISANDIMLLGPDGSGKFEAVQIKSIHSNRLPVKQVIAGQSAGFAIKKIKKSNIRKGMVLVDTRSNPRSCWEFEAEVVVLYHSTTIHNNYQPVVQCVTIRQSARIIKMDKELLRTGDKATVRFKFLYHPEFLKPGMRLIFREGKTKGMGTVIRPLFGEDKDKAS